MTSKSKPSRACKMCKMHKYLGNNTGRRKPKFEAAAKVAKAEMDKARP